MKIFLAFAHDTHLTDNEPFLLGVFSSRMLAEQAGKNYLTQTFSSVWSVNVFVQETTMNVLYNRRLAGDSLSYSGDNGERYIVNYNNKNDDGLSYGGC
jgi:hypothetical protein